MVNGKIAALMILNDPGQTDREPGHNPYLPFLFFECT